MDDVRDGRALFSALSLWKFECSREASIRVWSSPRTAGAGCDSVRSVDSFFCNYYYSWFGIGQEDNHILSVVHTMRTRVDSFHERKPTRTELQIFIVVYMGWLGPFGIKYCGQSQSKVYPRECGRGCVYTVVSWTGCAITYMRSIYNTRTTVRLYMALCLITHAKLFAM